MAFHITPAGPRVCRATEKRGCPYEEHYEDRLTANASFEAKNQTLPKPLSNKNNWLEPFIIPVEPRKKLILDNFTSKLESLHNSVVSGYSEYDLKSAKDFLEKVLDGEIPESLPNGVQYNDNQLPYYLHSSLCQGGYYAKITKQTAEDIAKYVGDGVVLDPMAGKGYLTKALREAGAKSIATDDNSWEISSAIEKMDALEAIEKYGDKITHVAIVWAPIDSDIDHKILMLCREKFPHITIINIGEPRNGCTGSVEFWDDAEEIFPDEYIHYSTTKGSHDQLSLMK